MGIPQLDELVLRSTPGKKLCYLEVARKSSTSTSCSEIDLNGCITATERPNHRNSYDRYFTHMLESWKFETKKIFSETLPESTIRLNADNVSCSKFVNYTTLEYMPALCASSCPNLPAMVENETSESDAKDIWKTSALKMLQTSPPLRKCALETLVESASSRVFSQNSHEPGKRGNAIASPEL